ncbi:MAG: L-ribulose-5-phosphate 4-epimerase [Planctomycetota bacterium]
MNLTKLREEVCHTNKMLPATGLVTMHSGNASGLDRQAGRLVIKPSGMEYDTLGPEDLVEVDLETGAVIDSELRPSVDLPHHLYLYRKMPEICGIVHTHSNYATAMAALGRPIPLCLTAIADQFGAEIPCTPYVDNEGNHIGRAIVKHRNRAPAVLLGNHGVFAWGPTPRDALKAAVMTEDVAKTVHLAMQIGKPLELPPEEAKKWYDRYRRWYGQA